MGCLHSRLLGILHDGAFQDELNHNMYKIQERETKLKNEVAMLKKQLEQYRSIGNCKSDHPAVHDNSETDMEWGDETDWQ